MVIFDMNFLESIKTCVLKKYTTTNGRASRSEFWYFFLFYILIITFSIQITPYLEENIGAEYIISGRNDYSGYLFFFLFIFGLGLLLPILSVTARRLNDIGLQGSNWIKALGILFITAGILSRLVAVEVGGLIAWGIYILFAVILILCLKPGDKKNNKLGKKNLKKIRK